MTDIRYRSRKFRLAFFALLFSTGLCAFGKISDTTYGYCMLITVGAYITGNVGQKALNASSQGGLVETTK